MPEPVVQPIPEEARTAVIELVREARGYLGASWNNADIEQEAAMALAIAAPHIDQAARIDELKRWAAELDEDVKELDKWARLPGTDIEGRERCEHEAAAYENVAECILERITELEASDVHPTDA